MSNNFKRFTFTVFATCLILFILIGCVFMFEKPESASAESQSEPEIVYLEPISITEDEIIFEIPLQTEEFGLSKLKYSISGKNNIITANSYDFYTTVYMLSILNIINKNAELARIYGIGNERINQLINNGLNAICSQTPSQLGYKSSIEQVLRANATLLFFCASLF